MTILELPVGYQVGNVAVHEWTQHLAVTRERGSDGTDYCICWIGTFALVTNDGGGWQPDSGSALGVLGDGSTAIDPNWPASTALAELVAETESADPRWALAKTIPFAAAVAHAATRLLPLVDSSFEQGETLEDVEVALDEFEDSGDANDPGSGLWGLAVGLLWLSEESRRHELAAH
jgi:hypothetical protein